MDRDEKIREFNKIREWEKGQLKVSPGKIIATTFIALVLMPIGYIVISWGLKHFSSESIQFILAILFSILLLYHWRGNNSDE